MKRIAVVFILSVLIGLPALSEEFDIKDVKGLKKVNSEITQTGDVKETYKLQGQIEYDDNPVETIYLDDDIDKPQINIPKRTLALPVSFLDIKTNTDSPRSALARASVSRNNLKDILPLSGNLSEQFRGITYGTLWGEELSLSQMESSTGVFLRYDAPKFFSLDTTFKQSASQDIGTNYGTVRVTPEWHITDKLTLKDSFTNYVAAPKNKNEITIVYTPALKKYAESLKFELGVAQSYYTNGRQSSAVSFSTGFKL